MKVEILIASYNNACYLRQCINSVLTQTYQNFFITFLDDCSTDETSQIIKEFPQDKIHYFRNDVNMGRGLSRTKLLKMASEEFCCWMDTDDYMMPAKIEKQVSYIQSTPSCIFLATEMFDLFRNGVIGLGCNKAQMINDLTLEKLRVSNCINHPTVMFRADIAREIGFHQMKRNEDWDFYIRLYEKGYKVQAIPELLYVYRLSI